MIAGRFLPHPRSQSTPGANPMTIVRMDHVMLATADVTAAMSRLRDRIGLATVYGGVHARGTHNALICFPGDLAYLELFGMQVPGAGREDRPDLYQWLEWGGGIWRFAVGSNDLEADHAAQAAADANPAPIGDHQRQRPDGVLLQWRMYRVMLDPRLFPFVIDWGADAPRLAELAASGHMPEHPIGASRIDHIGLWVADPAQVAADFGRYYGATIEQQSGNWIRLALGESRIDLTTPAASGPEREDWERRRDGIWTVAMSVRDLDFAVAFLERQGVRFDPAPQPDGRRAIAVHPEDAEGNRFVFVQGE